MSLLKRAVSTIGGLAAIAAVIAVYNLIWHPGYMSNPEGGYWGGYYSGSTSNKVWCLAVFFRENTNAKMLVITKDSQDVYTVTRDSNDETFVRYEMLSERSNTQIKANQLYLGKRYMWQRLLVGRFQDFWERNDDDSIRGTYASAQAGGTFEIERLTRERVAPFFNNFVLAESAYFSVSEIDTFVEQLKQSN